MQPWLSIRYSVKLFLLNLPNSEETSGIYHVFAMPGWYRVGENTMLAKQISCTLVPSPNEESIPCFLFAQAGLLPTEQRSLRPTVSCGERCQQ